MGNEKLEQLYEDIYIKQNQILAKLNATKDMDSVLVDVRGERLFYKDFPVSEADMEGFKEKFIGLVKGLDEDSIDTVVRAINRIKAIKNSTDTYMNLYTESEKAEYRYIEENYKNAVIKISDNCYFSKGIYLPEDFFEPCVFYDKCGARGVEHKEYFMDKDIIDAGAYIGDSAAVLSRMTNGKVHAFEPTSKSFNSMLETIKLNELEDKVIPYNLGLSDEKGTLTFTNSIVGTTNSQRLDSPLPYVSTEEVKVTTVDEIVCEQELQIGLIKVDVEGAEQLLLKGALNTIKTQKPTLLISIYHNGDDFYSIKQIIENLDLGYHFKITHPAFGSVLTETVLIAEL